MSNPFDVFDPLTTPNTKSTHHGPAGVPTYHDPPLVPTHSPRGRSKSPNHAETHTKKYHHGEQHHGHASGSHGHHKQGHKHHDPLHHGHGQQAHSSPKKAKAAASPKVSSPALSIGARTNSNNETSTKPGGASPKQNPKKKKNTPV